MLVPYLRSSSYNAWTFCEQRFFLEYILGIKSKSNLKADLGTIVHGVLEILAKIKLAQQNKEDEIENDIMGVIYVNNPPTAIKITDTVYSYYSERLDHHKWTKKEKDKCHEWVYKVLTDNGGIFNPLNCDVFAVEQHFDFEINKPWANYNLKSNDKIYTGQLALKGTCDLILKIDEETLEIRDYKTGKRCHWHKRGLPEKTLNDLYEDFQLRLYHLAIKHLYQVNYVIVSIYYINDGGLFTLTFDNDDIEKTLEMIKTRYEKMKNTHIPSLNRGWHCSAFCDYGKTTFDGTHIKPLKEFREGQVCKAGETMTKCEEVAYLMERFGPEWVTENLTHPDHHIDHYKDPGAV